MIFGIDPFGFTPLAMVIGSEQNLWTEVCSEKDTWISKSVAQNVWSTSATNETNWLQRHKKDAGIVRCEDDS